MEIFDTQVTTPYDDSYPPDANWRSTVALCWADHPEWRPPVRAIRDDPWIIRQRDFLTRLRVYGIDAVQDDKWRANRRAMSWYGGQDISDARFRIEPLLLTGAKFSLIALDMGGHDILAEDIETYCRLYFDVRDDKGALARSCYLRAYNALPDTNRINANTPDEVVWRMAAMYFGYSGVMYMWRWPADTDALKDDMFLHQEMMRAVQAHQMEEIIRGQISNFDLNTLVGHYINYKRLQHDTGEVENTDSEMARTVLGFMGLHRPHMLSAAKTVDEQEAQTAAIQSKLLAEKNVAQQMIADGGAAVGEERLNEIMNEHMKTPKQGDSDAS